MPFHVSKEAAMYFRETINKRNIPVYNLWVEKYNRFKENDSVLKKLLISIENNEFKIDLTKVKVNFEANYQEELRVTNAKVLDLIGDLSSIFVCGSADLASSTKVKFCKYGSYGKDNPTGRNIRFGVREHLMGAVMNGLALCGLRSICGTFLTFSDYMKPSIRLSSIMNLPVTYIFTHDSIQIEDGSHYESTNKYMKVQKYTKYDCF